MIDMPQRMNGSGHSEATSLSTEDWRSHADTRFAEINEILGGHTQMLADGKKQFGALQESQAIQTEMLQKLVDQTSGLVAVERRARFVARWTGRFFDGLHWFAKWAGPVVSLGLTCAAIWYWVRHGGKPPSGGPGE